MGYLKDGEDLDQAFARVKREAIGAAQKLIDSISGLLLPVGGNDGEILAKGPDDAIFWDSPSGIVPGELVFEAYVEQSGGDDPLVQTSGSLDIGRSYVINGYMSGDDFTNVGASSNTDGVRFIATGTTPAVWTNSSQLGYNTGAPTVSYILKNTLEVTGFSYNSIGDYTLYSNNALDTNKTFLTSGVTTNGSLQEAMVTWKFSGLNDIRIFSSVNTSGEDSALHCYIKIVMLP